MERKEERTIKKLLSLWDSPPGSPGLSREPYGNKRAGELWRYTMGKIPLSSPYPQTHRTLRKLPKLSSKKPCELSQGLGVVSTESK